MRRRPALAVFATAAVLAVALRGATAAPREGLHLENLVPASTLAFVSLEDVGNLGDRLGATAIGKMLADPEMKAFLGPVVEDVKQLISEKNERPMMPPEVREALTALQGLSGQVAIAAVRVPNDGPPTLCASLDFGDRLQDFTAFATRMVELAKKEGAPFEIEMRNDRPWFRLGDEGDRRHGPTFYGTTIGTAFLLSTDAAWLRERSDGTPVEASLGSAEGFRASREQAGGQDLGVFLFANVPEILERVPMPDEARSLVHKMGVDAFRSAAYGIAFRGDGFLETILVDAPNTDRGILPLMRTKPRKGTTLAWAPSKAFAYCDSGMEISQLIPRVRSLLQAVEPRSAAKMDEALGKARERLGIDVEREILPLLDDEFAYYLSLPETGGLYPEFAVSLAIKDPAATEAAFERLTASLANLAAESGGVKVGARRMDYHGKTLHVVDLASARRDLVPFTPTWAILGDRLVVTLVPHAMKEIVLRLETGDKGLAGEADVRALLSAAPEGAGGFGYMDLQALMTLAYDTVVPVLQTAAKPNLLPVPVRLDWAALPATRTLRPYFRSIGSFVTCDDRGLRMSIHSPTTYVPLIAVAMGAAFLTMGRGMSHATTVRRVPTFAPDPNADVARIGMRNLADAVEAYYLSNRHLPTSLDQLTEKDTHSGEPIIDSLPLDPWGNAYEYKIVDVSKNRFVISSPGPDGNWGTEDDLSYPDSRDDVEPDSDGMGDR